MPLLAKCIKAAGTKLQFKPSQFPSSSFACACVRILATFRIKFKAFDLLTFGSSSGGSSSDSGSSCCPVNVTTRLARNIRGPRGSSMQTGALEEPLPGWVWWSDGGRGKVLLSECFQVLLCRLVHHQLALSSLIGLFAC